ncbi:hypothetical protein IMSAGC019_01546 [Lachnospiraceae bacterium]|nr:hypothetical protein IMSAGC019_01546 [Lachnospiraceae bacterium]
MNRKMEYLYRRAEWFAVMKALIVGGDLKAARQEKLTEGWKLLLTNQFHDIIPGSSIFEVYQDCQKDYALIEEIGKEVEADFLSCAEKKEQVYTVINDSGFAMDGMVLLPEKEGTCARLGDGRALPVQRTAQGLLAMVEAVPPMGWVQVTVGKEQGEACENVFRADKRSFETPYYLLELNDYGQIARLYDREAGREVLPPGQRANVLQVFEDKPLNNDA